MQPDEKTIREIRAEFKVDFHNAVPEDGACLSTEEILALQSGAELEPAAREHLTHCQFCSALQQAIQVDLGRMTEFLREVRSSQPTSSPEVKSYRPPVFDWRLPTAALTAVASLMMVF